MNGRLFAWRLAACAWAAQIYALSSSARLTSNQTRSWLAVWLERWLGWTPPAETIRFLGTLIRKGAHVTEYAVLTWLLFRALEGSDHAQDRSRRIGWAIAGSAVYALADEFHQMFVPGRGASLTDWAIDMSGALLAAWALRSWPAAHRVSLRG